MGLALKKQESEVGRSKEKSMSVLYTIVLNSEGFLYIENIFDKHRTKPSYTRIWWPTEISRSELLPQFENLYDQLRKYIPPLSQSLHDESISFEPLSANLVMKTKYGTFKLEPKRIYIETLFDISEFISPLITKTAIAKGISKTALKKRLEEILSRNQKLKSLIN